MTEFSSELKRHIKEIAKTVVKSGDEKKIAELIKNLDVSAELMPEVETEIKKEIKKCILSNISVSINFGTSEKSTAKRNKGKSIIDFPKDYVLLDIETTGLSPEYDSIIEIGAVKVSGDKITDEFQSFVAYDDELPEFITELTGITDEMLAGAPSADEVIRNFDVFVGDNTIVGYNVNFDINFLYDYFETFLNKELQNNFIDCMRIARKLYPSEKHHRLKDMVEIYDISVEKVHRALDDCKATKTVFDKLHDEVLVKYQTKENFCKLFKSVYYSNKLNANDIKTTNTEFDVTHPVYDRNFVFTGTLEKMTRAEAMQTVVDLGGKVQNNVTSETNFLILGNNDYCTTIKNGKSNKQKKAESMMLKGKDIVILPENVFYDMIGDELFECQPITA